MHRGYIKIWRKLEDSGLLQMHGTLALFMHILLKATHKPTKIGTPIGVVELDRGQYVSGRHKLASAVGLTEREIRTCLTRLEELDILSIKTTSKYSIYTIVNYGNYQDCDQLNDQQQANNRPTIDQQSTTKQEHKHINTKEEIYTTRTSSLRKLLDRGVDEEIARDWLVIRKAKKLPLTDTAIKQVEAEAKISGLTFGESVAIAVKNGWAGYKSTWEDKFPNVSGDSKFDINEWMKAKQ